MLQVVSFFAIPKIGGFGTGICSPVGVAVYTPVDGSGAGKLTGWAAHAPNKLRINMNLTITFYLK